MLGQTLFLVAVIALFASTAMAGIAGFARAQTAAIAKAYVLPGTEAALAAYERDIRDEVVREIGVQPATYGAPPPALDALNGAFAWGKKTGLLPADSGTPLRIAYAVEPTTQAAPACTPGDAAVNAGPDTANDVQCSNFVQESRLSLAISTTVGPMDASGVVTPLASGRYTVTLRLFAQPPYAMVAGAKDAADPGELHEGDVAGWSGQNIAPTADDSTIHVIYACSGDSACTTSLPKPEDRTRPLPWSNGNGLAAAP